MDIVGEMGIKSEFKIMGKGLDWEQARFEHLMRPFKV
jgi:hypothetical protein